MTTVVLARLVALLSRGSVAADPLKNPNAFEFDLVCDNGETITIVTTNAAASGQIVTDTGVLIFRGRIILRTDLTTNEVSTITFSQGQGKKTGLQHDLVTCTGTIEFVNSDTGHLIHNEDVLYFAFFPRGQP